MLNSTDKFLVNDGSVTETVTWETIQLEIDPLIVTVTISPDEPEVNDVVSATPVVTGGSSPYSYTYQWVLADDVDGLNQANISGATTSTYTPVSSNKDKFLGCVVTATDTTGKSESATGYASNAVELGLVIAKPTILTPADGAGIGGDVTYTPETSAITAVDDVPGGGAAKAPEDNIWYGVAYGNGVYVAVSSDGTNQVMYSSDAINWTSASATEANNWKDIAFGNGKFVAVADSGTNRTMYSSDGISWTSGTPAISNDHRAVCYGNGLFVATGTEKVSYSSDGINWNSATTAASITWRGVTYGNNKYVAISGSGADNFMYSPDAVNWTLVSGAPSANYYDVTYGNGTFVAVANNGKAAYSTDGVNWTEATTSNKTWESVTYGNGKFVAVSYGDGVVTYSTDGINWTDAADAEANYWRSVTYGGNKFVAVASGGTNRVMYSADGVTWTGDLTKLTFTNDKAYDSADGTEMTTIDQAFKAGDKVVGEGDATVFADTLCFATDPYTGSSSPQTRNTGVNNTKKSLVWVKNKGGNGHYLFDTIRGVNKALDTTKADGERDTPNTLIEFTDNGFKVGTGSGVVNQDGYEHVAWNFRGAPGFMDVVTYEGGELTIPHDLGVKPGLIITKRYEGGNSMWGVYHTKVTAVGHLILNSTDAAVTNSSPKYFTSEPTDSEFYVSANGVTGSNDSNEKFVAYLFADNPDSGIKCATYDGNGDSGVGGTNETFVDCGFDAGWVLIKSPDESSTNWIIFDSKRDGYLKANSSDVERGDASMCTFGSGGFTLKGNSTDFNAQGKTYIYVAIAEDASAGQFMPTGVLTEDAAGTSMTLTDVTGEWAPGLTAVNETEATEYAPDADDIVFTSSKPVAQEGESLAWGAAEWQLSTDSSFSNKQTSSVFLADSDPELGPTNFNLGVATEYWVRTRYNSSNPEVTSEWSDSNKFQTGVGEGWYAGNTSAVDGDKDWHTVAYGNGKFLAIRYNNDIALMESTDGINWSNNTNLGNQRWTTIAFGNNKFVAACYVPGSNDECELWYSEDGNSWTKSANSPIQIAISYITYANNRFVAMGWTNDTTENFNCVYSDDGVSWFNGSGIDSYPEKFKSPCYVGNNTWIAWTTWKQATSTDNGQTWTTKSTSSLPGTSLYSAYDGSAVVTLYGNVNDEYAYSTDRGSSWQTKTLPDFEYTKDIIYANGLFVACRNVGSPDNIRIISSPDGLNWTKSLVATNNGYGIQLESLAYSEDLDIWVAVGPGSGPPLFSKTGSGVPPEGLYYDTNASRAIDGAYIRSRHGISPDSALAKKLGYRELTEQPTYEVAAYVKEGDKYKPIRDYSTEATNVNQTISTTKASLETRIAALESQE